METRRVRQRLSHMLDAVAAIERVTRARTLEQYGADPDLAAMVERYLERLSEASRHVPDALKGRYPEVDWRGVADIGNLLRHAYDQIADHRIWQIVTTDLGRLRRAVEAMLEEVERVDRG